MCLIRRTIAYLCPNMINFDVVDFSECRSEVVMFLMTLGVHREIAEINESTRFFECIIFLSCTV